MSRKITNNIWGIILLNVVLLFVYFILAYSISDLVGRIYDQRLVYRQYQRIYSINNNDSIFEVGVGGSGENINYYFYTKDNDDGECIMSVYSIDNTVIYVDDTCTVPMLYKCESEFADGKKRELYAIPLSSIRYSIIVPKGSIVRHME